MASALTSINLRPQTGRRKPSNRELVALHKFLHQEFYYFGQQYLMGAASNYFKHVSYFDAEAVQLMQAETFVNGETLWRLSWEVYSHSSYLPFEHWLRIFLAQSGQVPNEIDLKVEQKKFEVVPAEQSLTDLLLAPPIQYQYITLDCGFYLLDLHQQEAMRLRSASASAVEGIVICQEDILPLDSFTPDEQHLIEQARESKVCQCSICVSLRRQLSL